MFFKIHFFSGFRSFNNLRIDHAKFDTDSTSTQRATAVFMSTGQTTRIRETAIFAIYSGTSYNGHSKYRTPPSNGRLAFAPAVLPI